MWIKERDRWNFKWKRVILKLTHSPNLEKNQKQTIPNGINSKIWHPSEIVKKIGVMAYKLKFLERLKFHLSFHLSFLKPYHKDPNPKRVQVKQVPPNIQKEFGREIASILKDRNMGIGRTNGPSSWFTRKAHPRVKRARKNVSPYDNSKTKCNSTYKLSLWRHQSLQVGKGLSTPQIKHVA